MKHYLFQLRYNNIRIAYPKTFLFGIHYYIDLAKSEIIIVAIIDNKCNFIEGILGIASTFGIDIFLLFVL